MEQVPLNMVPRPQETVMLNTRAKDMLLRMIVSGHPVRIKHLAEEFHVSTRTIKYDIESIRLWLNEQHLCLQSHTKRGFGSNAVKKRKTNCVSCWTVEKDLPFFLVRKKEIPKFCSSF
ncbi:HTH domain-containing protein [Paenibacillus larvae]|uniref:HTH domain-containing protein n=1 Tax=Paenibacillus larvae TaxID=1464 RepID=UPI0037C99E8F